MPGINHIQKKHNANARNISALDFIYREIAQRMVDRLDYIKFTPDTILDIGSGSGIDSGLLKSRFPAARVIEVDIAVELLKHNRPQRGMLQKLLSTAKENYVCADALNLPLLSQSVNMVWSNLCLPYITDMEAYFKEIRRVLALGGVFLVSGFGVDSLEQLRDVGLTTYDFPDMHLIGDILVKLGFSHPVTDVEHITLEYDNPQQLLTDIRISGSGAAALRKTALSGDDYRKLPERLAQLGRNGKIPLTLEVFYAHAWKDSAHLDLPSSQKVLQFHPRNS